MSQPTDDSAHAAVLRYIEHAASGNLGAAEASVDGANAAELYTCAAGYATLLLDQFSFEGEAPLAELLDSLVTTTANTWGLDEPTTDLVAGFAALTGYEGDWSGTEAYTAAVEARPDEATSAALIHTATLTIIVADATGVSPSEALELLEAA